METRGVSRKMPAALDASTNVLVIGAGACGLVAALRAADQGADVVVVERDPSPFGSTSMASGFIPAPGTRFQRDVGVDDDSPALLQADIVAKTHGQAVPHLAELASRRIGPALEWLADRHGLDWIVLDDFLYPGHTRHRMHAVPEKTGASLMVRLTAAAEAAGIPIVTEAEARTLHLDDDSDRIGAVTIARPGGSHETIGCRNVVLACSGFAGDAQMVASHMPEIASGLFFGHAGNRGSALRWGEALGARLEHLSGYQGHGSVAHPHGILISWALIMRGGIQVNSAGARFSDESAGYSEQAVHVLRQPDGVAWDVYDEAIHEFALGFPDYRQAAEAGAVRRAETTTQLAEIVGARPDAIAETLASVERFRSGAEPDPFGRVFDGPGLEAPWYAARVTGALFHTQGGLMIDEQAHVLRDDGRPFPNLFAGGGAACGVSGPDVSGYLSGNGLLTAVAFGFVAGENAARGALAERG